jgi:nucleotide-binding universal stress UspA family protein
MVLMVYRKAIVGLDLSRLSDILVDWLPELGRMGLEEIVLFHAIPSTTVPTELIHRSPLAPQFISLVEELRNVAMERLERYAGRLRERGLRVEYMRPIVGDPARELVSAASALGCDLIVVGSRGLGWLTAKLLGSVSEAVVNNADRPVLVAKYRIDREPGPPPSPWGVMVAAVDLSPTSRLVLEAARGLSKATGSRVVVVHVSERRGEEMVRDLVESVGLEAEIRVMQGDPCKRVLEVAEEVGAGLIIIGSKPRRGLKELLLGSTGDYIVRRARTNVLVVREHI